MVAPRRGHTSSGTEPPWLAHRPGYPSHAPRVLRRRRRPSKGGSLDQLLGAVRKGDCEPERAPVFSDRARARLDARARRSRGGKAAAKTNADADPSGAVIPAAELEPQLRQMENTNQ